MDAGELKTYIIQNQLISQVLSSLGCTQIKEGGTEWRAALPGHHNPSAICIKKDTLTSFIRTSKGETRGDIYTLISSIKVCSFVEAIQWLHKIFVIPYSYRQKHSSNKIPQEHPLDIFKKIRKRNNPCYHDVTIYDENILREGTDLPYIEWIREGIMPFACRRFKIGYSFDKNRILIPERKWDGDENEFIGIMGRTTLENYDLMGIPKYLPIKPYPKGQNVYGLNENYQSIQKAGYVVVFESQKSVLKRYSRKDETGTAIGGCQITDWQVKILISLNVEIVLAFDEGVPLESVKKECEKFCAIRKVSYIFDKWGLLKSKESPADKEDKIYRFLFKHRHSFVKRE